MEIVVLGRPNSAFEAPGSVVRLEAGTLTDRGIGALDDLAPAIAGLHLINDQDPGTNITSMRGATSDRLQAAAIAYIVDGVPLPDTELFTAPLFDVASVTAFRGPQGALFGKNAAGGALSIATARGPGGFVRATLGDGGRRDAEAALGGARGDVSWRAAALWTAAEGWIRNTTLNRIVDAEERKALRLSAQTTVAGWSIDAVAQALEEDGGAAWASSGDVTGDFAGRLDGAALTNPQGDYEGRAYRRWLRAQVRAEHALGPATLALSLARDIYAKRWTEELDYRAGPLTFFGAPIFPNGLQPIAQPIDLTAWTGQATLDAPLTQRLDGRIGVFASTLDRQRTDDFGPLLFGGDAARYETQADQAAVFAALDWRATDALTLSGALRWDRDARTQAIANARTGAAIDRRDATFERVQPQAAARWRLNEDALVYAAYGEAFRTGGFNPLPGANSIWRAQFAPETTRSLEIGWKRRGFPADGRIELAAFAARVRDYQNYTFLDAQSVTLGVDRVRIEGLEAAGGFSPIEGLSLDAAYAFAHARIDDFIAPDPLITGATRNYSGKQVPNAPRWSATLGVAYARTLGAYAIEVRADGFARGPTTFEIDNALRAPTTTWLDLRASTSRGPWRLSAWAKNAMDERWAISAFGQGMLPLLQGLGPDGPFDTFTINRGRMVGVDLTRRF